VEIATLLIVLWTGRKRNRMTLTMVGLYLQGWADEEELTAFLKRLAPAQDTNVCAARGHLFDPDAGAVSSCLRTTVRTSLRAQ